MGTDITLIFPRSPFLIREDVMPPLGILHLASALKIMDFNVQCLDLGLGHTLDMVKSEIVGVSITSPQRDEAYAIAKRMKAEGRITIAGGPHATHCPNECKKNGFDFVFRGEGDTTLPIFLYYHQKGKKKYNSPIITSEEVYNIDAFPFPDRDALPIKNYHYEINGKPATVIITSRGCPYTCSFCSKASRKFRLQSAERTVNEILHIYEKYSFEAFMIFDDVFIADFSRLKSINLLLSARKFTFRCFGRANLLNDTVCDELKRLNVVEVGIGIESGSNAVLQKSMKGTSREINLKAVKNLRKRGIRAKAFLIVGLPGENFKTIAETESWIKEAQPDDIDISIFQPLPGSEIYRSPESFGIEFDKEYSFFKGKKGEYKTSVRGELTSEQLLKFRDYLEDKYKSKNLLK